MAGESMGVVLRHLRGLFGAHTTAEVTDGQLLEHFTSARQEDAFATLLLGDEVQTQGQPPDIGRVHDRGHEKTIPRYGINAGGGVCPKNLIIIA